MLINPYAFGNRDNSYNNVALLLHFDGTNNSTTFTDKSKYSFSPTAFGNVKISTANSRFGDASGLFDGSGDYLRYPSDAAFNIPGDFTIECWVYPLALKTLMAITARRATTDNSNFGLYIDNGVLKWLHFQGGVTYIRTGGSVALNTWSHIAVSRTGNTYNLFVNGSRTQITSTGSDNTVALPLLVGWDGVSSTRYYNGYIDEFRLTPGICRYTAAFTPPTTPFPDS